MGFLCGCVVVKNKIVGGNLYFQLLSLPQSSTMLHGHIWLREMYANVYLLLNMDLPIPVKVHRQLKTDG